MEELVRFAELRSAYDRSFERLREDVEMLRRAEQRVREAELNYRRRRDELAEFILHQHGPAVEETEPVDVTL